MHVNDGVSALSSLRNSGEQLAGPPDLILLDLNMPRMDGRGVLRELRTDERLQLIPVVVLSTSGEERDITSAYSLGANAYVVKPVDLVQFYAVIQGILDFWVGIAAMCHGR